MLGFLQFSSNVQDSTKEIIRYVLGRVDVKIQKIHVKYSKSEKILESFIFLTTKLHDAKTSR